MKLGTIKGRRRLALLGLALVALSGCDILMRSPLDTLQGAYWIEHIKGELILFELSGFRTAAADWYALRTPAPRWYSGPAVYEAQNGTWSRLTMGDEGSLDELLQLWDPAPSAPAASGVRP